VTGVQTCALPISWTIPFNSFGKAGGDVKISPSVYSKRHTTCSGVTSAEGLCTSTTMSTPSTVANFSKVPTSGNFAADMRVTASITEAITLVKVRRVFLFMHLPPD
jgi:hypothetical protein